MTRPGRPGIPQSVMLVSHLPDEIPSNDTVDQDPPERQEHVEYEAGDRDRRCRLDKVELAQHDHDDDLRHLQAPRRDRAVGSRAACRRGVTSSKKMMQVVQQPLMTLSRGQSSKQQAQQQR